MDTAERVLNEVVGEQLSAVTFVQDYLQLHFDGPTINVYIACSIIEGGRTDRVGDRDFRNSLCGRIGKKVTRVLSVPDRHLDIYFEDESLIRISLASEDYVGPRAMETLGFSRGDLAF